ncbi:DUF2975 domain-containing protein [Pedobacter sp. SG908]|uniref:DUF2975 domain-containing protein n=1 Tax=Pedobacter sp. SG908 TaxID=2587135 RepID=UPI001421DEAC|nr:DUF2975 domain-containing protein [Pedobacter sp. SG908]NII82500.1 hypothetical protein [Pedobacter sp. SG908]
MKLSESKVIKNINRLATIVLVFYFIFLLQQFFTSSSPAISKAVKSYEVYNVKLNYFTNKAEDPLKSWFNDTVVVQKTDRALVHLRFRSYDQLFLLPALLFQFSIVVYWLLIGAIIILIKMFFQSLTKDKVFTIRNASIIIWGSLLLICLPIARWFSQELFVSCINQLHLNDSKYALSNGEGIIASETVMGLITLAFGLAFKVGVDIKQENESFV